MFELTTGLIVADKYRIDGVMGTGGMGVVVAATHLELEQRVAIKFLREVSPEALARFQREARLLVRLKSPHVARVMDVGSLDDDTPYIVMEHLEGSDLASVVTSRGKLSVEETVDYILQASEAVAEAHAMGMVHRDLKPANIFLARGPGGTTVVKVLDFGVSKILDDRSNGVSEGPRGGDLTNEGVALGSPGYMSPEQMTSSRDVDARSDIFSLGALLYRLVGGQTPYKGTSVVSILATMATEGLLPLGRLAPDAPESFVATVARCLAHDKAMRFPTVAHLAHALMPYASRRGRVSIEQILATLGVEIPDDPASDGRMRARLGDMVVRPALPPAPLFGPAPPSSGLGRAMDTGPQSTVSPPGWMPAAFVPSNRATRFRALRRPIVIAVLGMFCIVVAVAAWRARRPTRAPAASSPTEQPAPPTAIATSAAMAAAPIPTASLPTEPAVAPSATAASAAPDKTTPRPRGTGTTRARPHAASPRTTAPPMVPDPPSPRR